MMTRFSIPFVLMFALACGSESSSSGHGSSDSDTTMAGDGQGVHDDSEDELGLDSSDDSGNLTDAPGEITPDGTQDMSRDVSAEDGAGDSASDTLSSDPHDEAAGDANVDPVDVPVVDASSDDGSGIDVFDSGCPGWPCAQPSESVPNLRMTSLQYREPAGLASLQTQSNEAFNDLSTAWLMTINIDALTMDTGIGLASSDAFCSAAWNETDPPITDIPITISSGASADLISTVDGYDLDLPLSDEPDSPYLPIRDIRFVDLALSTDRCFVGAPGRRADYARTWTVSGQLQAYIAFEESKEFIAVGDLTICDWLCGTFSDHCTELTPTECGAVPIPDTEPVVYGYHVIADVGGGATTIASGE